MFFNAPQRNYAAEPPTIGERICIALLFLLMFGIPIYLMFFWL